MNEQRLHVGIVGAGIIGISTACHLAERGVSVTVFDPEEPGMGGASQGNASQIFPALIHPLASPAVMRDAFRLLTDSTSPLSIPRAYVLRMLPWLAGFVRASHSARYHRGVAALTELNRHAYAGFKALLQRAGEPGLLKQTGAIQLYESDSTLEKGLRLWEQVPSSHAGAVTALTEEELRDLEPALGPAIKGGVLIPSSGVLSDPSVVVAALASYAQRLGVQLCRERVVHMAPDDERTAFQLQNGGTRNFNAAVVAAGVWSGELCARLSEPQPLESERGYNLTIPVDGHVLEHALVFAERGVVATQLSCGLRFGGWDELGGTKAPSNPKLFVHIQRLAAELLPRFDWSTGRQWMGHRPSLPDTLPVIARSKKHPLVYYAFGHGHLGMTQGPVTGEAIAALISGEQPRFDLEPFALR